MPHGGRRGMPGIVVGVDQSEHAHLALDWAMREAGIRGEALTVISIVTAEASPWTGHPLTVPDADNAVARARQAAEEAVAKSAGQLGDRQPSSVTVSAVVGFPVQALVNASHDADLLVVGSRGAGASASFCSARSPARSRTTRPARSSSCRRAVVSSAARKPDLVGLKSRGGPVRSSAPASAGLITANARNAG